MAKAKRRAFLVGAAAAIAAWRRGGRAPGRRQAGRRRCTGRTASGPEKTPLFSGVTSYGGLVFMAGIGAHFEGDIKAHTKHVLDEIQSSSSPSAPRWRRS